MTAKEAESLLIKSGFLLARTKGSHRIYKNNNIRVVLPFHAGKDLHPKIVKEIKSIIENLTAK